MPHHNTDKLLKKFLLKNDLASEEEITKSFDIRKQVSEFGGQITIVEILFHKNILSRNQLQILHNQISESFPILERHLPPKSFLEVQSISNIAPKALEEGCITDTYLEICENLQEEYESIGLQTRTIGDLLIEMRFLNMDNLQQITSPPLDTDESVSGKQQLNFPKKNNKHQEVADKQPTSDSISIDYSSVSSNSEEDPEVAFYEDQPEQQYLNLPGLLGLFSAMGLLVLVWFIFSESNKNQTILNNTNSRTAQQDQSRNHSSLNASNESSSGSNAQNASTNPKEDIENQKERTNTRETPKVQLQETIQLPRYISHPTTISSSLVYLGNNQQISSKEIETNQDGTYNISFGPFQQNRNVSRLPPGIYNVKNTFDSSPFDLPQSIRFATEKYVQSDYTLPVLEGSTWEFPILIIHQQDQLTTFLSKWMSFIQQATDKLEKFFQEWKTNQGRIQITSPQTRKNQLTKKFLKIINNVKSIKSSTQKKLNAFVASPFHKSSKHIIKLTEILQQLSIVSLKTTYQTDDQTIPAEVKQDLDSPGRTSLMNRSTSSLKNDFKRILKRLKTAVKNHDPNHFIQDQLQAVLDSQTHQLLLIKPLLDALRKHQTFRREAFVRNDTPIKSRLSSFRNFVLSYILIQKSFFETPLIDKKYRSLTYYQTFYQQLFRYAQAVLKKVITSTMKKPSSLLQELLPRPEDLPDSNKINKRLQKHIKKHHLITKKK